MMKTSYPKTVLVLGASGLVGGSLFTTLTNQGASVVGTARTEKEGLLAFDSSKPGSIESFPWNDFDIIVDCTGVMQYEATPAALVANMAGNVRAPLAIVAQLNTSQHYFYCSSHAVLAPENERTTYATSKALFEEQVREIEGSARVTIVRLPAVFSEQRTSGLLHRIKEHFVQKKPLELEVVMSVWHAMYLPRVTDVFSTLIQSAPEESIVTIGYPVETSFDTIRNIAESVFGPAILIHVNRFFTDHYVPEIDSQQQYAVLHANDFEDDVRTYFKK